MHLDVTTDAKPMLPRLTALQWIILLVFLFLYGFAVFAFTRDYYLRHLPRNPPAAPVPHQVPDTQANALGERMRQALDGQGRDSEIDLSSTDAVALGDAADRLFVAKRFDEAIPLYRRVLELQPEDAETQNDLGLALNYLGRSQDAIRILQRGAESAPDFQRIWLSLGFVALQNDENALARKALQQAQSLAPDTEIADEATRLLRVMDGSEAKP